MKKNLLMYLVLCTSALFTYGCNNVEADPIGITISANENVRNIKVDDTLQLTAIVYPENASQSVSWASSDETIATVDTNGLVTGVSVGTVNITATSTTNESISQSYAIIVEAKEVVEITPESITISSTNDETSLKAGETLTLTAVVLPSGANQGVSWASSDETIATVTRGEVLGLKEGSVTITATSKELSTVTSSIDLTIEKSDDPVVTKDWPNMDFTSHDTYMTCDNDTPLKVKGVVTHVAPVDEGNVSYYIQNETEGYFVYAQNATLYPVELGKSYEVGGLKKYYRGLNEIVNVEYFVESSASYSYVVNDLTGIDVTDKTVTNPYQASYVSGVAIVSQTPSVSTKAFSVYVTINGYSTSLRVDPSLMSEEEFNSISSSFAATLPGSEVTFKGMMIAYGYGSNPDNQIQIVKSNDLEFSELSDEDVLNAAVDKLSIQSSIGTNTSTITLPSTISAFDNVSVSWTSDSEIIDATTGIITHPEQDSVVNLTATISCGEYKTTKQFNVTVLGVNTSYTTLATLNLDDAADANSWGNSATKSGYDAATITLGTPSLSWYLSSALIAASTSDHYDGKFSIRAKSGSDNSTTGRIEVRNDDEYNVVQFDAAVYGSDDLGIKIGVEYSLDQGTTWIDSGAIVSIDTTTLTTYRITLPSGVKRVAIYVVANTGNRVNIDNILLMN